MVYMLASIYLIQSMMLTYHLLSDNRDDPVFQIVFMTYNVMMILLEAIQMKSQGFRPYINDIFNWFEIVGYFSLIIYASMYLSQNRLDIVGDRFLLLGSVCCLANGVS